MRCHLVTNVFLCYRLLNNNTYIIFCLNIAKFTKNILRKNKIFLENKTKLNMKIQSLNSTKK